MITTPNVDGFQARLFASGWRSAIADHLVLFSRRTLEDLLRARGFAVRQHVTWGGLAAGSAPALVKRPMDRLAKRWGSGTLCSSWRRSRWWISVPGGAFRRSIEARGYGLIEMRVSNRIIWKVL